MKFVLRISGDMNVLGPLEDSGTGGPGSVTVRMENLFAFQF